MESIISYILFVFNILFLIVHLKSVFSGRNGVVVMMVKFPDSELPGNTGELAGVPLVAW